VAFVSDAVFYGGGQPLSIFEHGGTLKTERLNTEDTERRAQRPQRRNEFKKKKGGGPGLPASLSFPVSGKTG
jgi:hypothetical protein